MFTELTGNKNSEKEKEKSIIEEADNMMEYSSRSQAIEDKYNEN